ncbi:MAG: DUF2262 domain-containing protein [Oscillospiraceae bacterium]|nr:DUF2262 domain-containing protein [Oscillospiraceae bacterium]
MSFFKKLFHKEPKPEPIVIINELGSFTYSGGRSNLFEGMVEWCDNTIDVFLDPDDGETITINTSLQILRKLLAQAQEWDQKLKEYSAEDLLRGESDGLIHIWGSPEQLQDDVPPVTKEEYMERISLGFMHISLNGDIYFDYSLDNMFTDHGMGIQANISGEIFSAGLQG